MKSDQKLRARIQVDKCIAFDYENKLDEIENKYISTIIDINMKNHI